MGKKREGAEAMAGYHVLHVISEKGLYMVVIEADAPNLVNFLLTVMFMILPLLVLSSENQRPQDA